MCSDFVLDDPGACIEDHRRYMVVDCGGGTVDITVHEMSKEGGKLKELFKATGGPFGSTTVDEAFKVLMIVENGYHRMEIFNENHIP